MRYFSNFARNLRQLDLFKMFSVVLVVANTFLAINYVNVAKDKEIIIVPPNVNSQFSVVGNSFSTDYYEEVGRSLSNGLMNLSPDNVDYSFDSIQAYFSSNPDEAIAIKKKLSEDSERIKKDNIYQSFFYLRTIVNHKNNKFTVEGTLRSSTGSILMENVKKSIDFEYKIENKRIKIISFEVK